MSKNADDYTEISRTYDKIRFISSLFANANIRNHMHVLHCFNIEASKALYSGDNEISAIMRLQWWSNIIDDIYAKKESKSEHLCAFLSKIVQQTCIKKQHFERYFKAKESLIYDRYFFDMHDIEKYADDTIGAMSCMAIEISGEEIDDEILEAINFSARAYFSSYILRNVFHGLSKAINYFPRDLLNEAGIDMKTFDDRDVVKVDALIDISKIITDRAILCVDRARDILKRMHLKRELLHVFFPMIFVDGYLVKLKRNNYNILRCNEIPYTSSMIKLPIKYLLNRL